MTIFTLGSSKPSIHDSAWVAATASVIGDVRLLEQVSIWFGAVLRGDIEAIEIGRRSNVQDNCVIHAHGGRSVRLGEDVTVGHMAMLHGCTIGDGTMIGMQATVMNGAKIGRNCLVAAGSLVTQNVEIPDGQLVIGRPAMAVRDLSSQEIAFVLRAAQSYVTYAASMRKGLRAA